MAAGPGPSVVPRNRTAGSNVGPDDDGLTFETSPGVEPITSFDQMGIRDDLLRGIYAYGFEKPSAIQQRAVMPIINGRDVIAQAQYGTGKSSMIALTVCQMVDTSMRELERGSESVPAMAGTEEEQLRMVNAGSGDEKRSEKMMTVDCLRGRLVAERNTSKAAREEAELMGKRLVELESQLKMELESQRKAEKKLKLAMKKLESLKLSPSVSQSNSSVTESSFSPPSQVRKKQEDCLWKENYDPSLSNNFDIVEADSVHQTITADGGFSSGSPAHSDPHEVTSKADACHASNSNISDSTSSTIGESPPGGENHNQEDDYVETVDNSLALVKVEEKIESVDNSQALVPLDPMDYNMSSNDNHVCEVLLEVLLALRQARQQLQASIGRTTVYGSHSFGLCGV